MSIKVKEVLELAQSKGCTLAAGEGGMDRIVRFVDCMEIPDMKAWMRPNVLYITTGYAYSDTKEEIMNLIRNLYEAKAAALATKYRYIGCFLDDAIKLANELQFPIILWPEDLPFIEMNYLVMEALIKSQNNPYQIVYIEIDGIKQKLHELQEEIVHEKIEKIENMIKESFGEEKVIVLSNNDNFQCILKRTKEKTITKEYFEKIQKNISEKTGYTAAIGVSRVENSYQRFGKAYQDARDAVEIAVCQEFNSKVLCIEDAGFWRIMKEISKHEMCQEFMEDKLNAFIEYDQKNESELLETLEVLVNNLGARNVTANALHLHRNTLIYRIKKIENQTGYDLSDPNSILEIALALRIKKFLK